MKVLLFFIVSLLAIFPSISFADEYNHQFGGCWKDGEFCAGPSAAIQVASFNLSTSKFSGGVIPGIGYGVTYRQDEWYATGAALYISFLIGQGQPNQAIPALMFSFANYVRFGIGVSITEQDSGPAQTQWQLFLGLGSDFGGSSSYLNRNSGSTG